MITEPLGSSAEPGDHRSGTRSKAIPVTLVTGFLGAGKTSLLNKVVQMCEEKKIAVIENEFGVVNLDAKLGTRYVLITDCTEERYAPCCAIMIHIVHVRLLSVVHRNALKLGQTIPLIGVPAVSRLPLWCFETASSEPQITLILIFSL